MIKSELGNQKVSTTSQSDDIKGLLSQIREKETKVNSVKQKKK
jgi:hypothetical protein